MASWALRGAATGSPGNGGRTGSAGAAGPSPLSAGGGESVFCCFAAKAVAPRLKKTQARASGVKKEVAAVRPVARRRHPNRLMADRSLDVIASGVKSQSAEGR